MPQLDLSTHHLAQLQLLLVRHVPDAEVWAFGSRVNGTAHDGSDLDLVLRKPQDLDAPVDGWMDLKEALQASRLPMLVEVHDWAHLPAAFHAEISQKYLVVQNGRETGCADSAEIGKAGG
ncbi:MAG: nucleotidyltransferase family protein [Burkholderiaceae bacterium]